MSEERVAAYVHACHHGRTGSLKLPVSAEANLRIRRTTIGCVALLGAVSYHHMHILVARQGSGL